MQVWTFYLRARPILTRSALVPPPPLLADAPTVPKVVWHASCTTCRRRHVVGDPMAARQEATVAAMRPAMLFSLVSTAFGLALGIALVVAAVLLAVSILLGL